MSKYNEHHCSSYEVLSEKSGKRTMNLAQKRVLCIKVYETLNGLNPSFMKKAT